MIYYLRVKQYDLNNELKDEWNFIYRGMLTLVPWNTNKNQIHDWTGQRVQCILDYKRYDQIRQEAM
jgi:hypothetical protein